MKKFITIIGVYILTVISVYLVDSISQLIYYNIYPEKVYDPVVFSIYTVAGLIGVCTYIICTRKK